MYPAVWESVFKKITSAYYLIIGYWSKIPQLKAWVITGGTLRNVIYVVNQSGAYRNRYSIFLDKDLRGLRN